VLETNIAQTPPNDGKVNRYPTIRHGSSLRADAVRNSSKSGLQARYNQPQPENPGSSFSVFESPKSNGDLEIVAGQNKSSARRYVGSVRSSKDYLVIADSSKEDFDGPKSQNGGKHFKFQSQSQLSVLLKEAND